MKVLEFGWDELLGMVEVIHMDIPDLDYIYFENYDSKGHRLKENKTETLLKNHDLIVRTYATVIDKRVSTYYVSKKEEEK